MVGPLNLSDSNSHLQQELGYIRGNELFLMRLLFILSILFFISCQEKKEFDADLILTNGVIYPITSDDFYSSMAIKDGNIIALSNEELQLSARETINLNGQFAMPGFIEGHGHFSGVGSSLQNLNFLNSKSWDEIVAMVEEEVQSSEPGEWIIGRGWHQEKWDESPANNIHGYPYHNDLSAISPDNPVLLTHASGHGSFANKAAMDRAGISKETSDPVGGEIVRDPQGNAIGMFEERAQGLIRGAYSEYLETLTDEEKYQVWLEGHKLAEQECFQKGITSFQDAGSSFETVDRYMDLAENGDMQIRLWVMIRSNPETIQQHIGNFPQIGIGDQKLTVRAFKSSIDGALGAFGAWLLEPYADKVGFYGQNTTPVFSVRDIAKLAVENDMQYCVHAIGDRANRVVLDIFEGTFAQFPEKEDLRWRMEHAQHVDTSDIPRFNELGVIASMQGIHCTSDAPYVEKRLGTFRAKYGSYAWRSFLDKGVVIANGTDAPVEDVDPLPSLYASVTRKRLDNGMVFFPEQAMTRKEALYSYTMGNAYAAFEEESKGSLEVGKLGDVVVLDKNLVTCTDDEIVEANILYTIVGGEVMYRSDN